MKRALVFILSIALCVFTVGCGKGTTECSSSTYTSGSSEGTKVELSFTAEHFLGKMVVVYGDSITHGVGTSEISKTYVDLLSKQLGFMYDNFAVSGSMLTYVNAMTDGRESGVEIMTNSKDYNEKADYALIMYGANDSTHRVAHTTGYEETPTKLDEVHTFRQGIEYAVKTLKEHNEGITIIFITPILRTDNDGFSVETLKQYTDLIVDLSGDLGYYYVNAYSLFTMENFGENSQYTTDKCHPNDAGNQKIYEFLLHKALSQKE